ncbi:5-amino-6-(5-phosphoribosylamino)uracil reductase [Buchnera aphidicola (Schlechtendalia chinensis)]|uniref:Riboflavin biosynthesis protein RibD n=1 Tax=Buchnera aphidicola subsp. Schlechtendalia chinensis TaxID=118110 RepID=A0A172WDX1_BUCSC|nr:bifunctional diaminohydroxyphosphoribosylaminopyrimidine deaminase/5-amino-6-(5-phosphoribosylamino)uracil reductase RibD [Buchnera aphidicola]ANF17174.1 5-amino-6-(5-phosphoribosylamino)uracil reductase [Buchnera aphidicola (Schlechtendalia chinensis)]
MKNNAKDIFYMKEAIKIAKKGELTTSPNPNVGCIIVKNDIIIGTGWHKKSGKPHAEIYALKKAGEKAKQSTVYITLEPCCHFGKTPPCCIALIKAGVAKVVISSLDPNPMVSGKGIQWLKKEGIIVKVGIISYAAESINKGFFQRMRIGIPWIQLKLASSIDGRTALKNGISKWITSSKSRQDVQIYRKKSDAIISSSHSVIMDNALLTVRKIHRIEDKKKYLKNQETIKQPLRIIIDSKNRMTPFHRCIKEPGKILLIRLKYDRNRWPKNVEQVILKNNTFRINLIDLLKLLGKRQINKVLIETGASLSGAFLKLNVVNEIIIYMAPKMLGNYSKPLFMLENYKKLQLVPQFSFKNVKKIGKDIRLILIKNKKGNTTYL